MARRAVLVVVVAALRVRHVALVVGAVEVAAVPAVGEDDVQRELAVAALRGRLDLRDGAVVATAPVDDLVALRRRRHHVAGDDLEAGRERLDGGFTCRRRCSRRSTSSPGRVGRRCRASGASTRPCRRDRRRNRPGAAGRSVAEIRGGAERVDPLGAVELVVVGGAGDARVDDRVVRRGADRRLALDDELPAAGPGASACRLEIRLQAESSTLPASSSTTAARRRGSVRTGRTCSGTMIQLRCCDARVSAGISGRLPSHREL